MNRYLKLVHFELFRVRKLYFALIALTLALQGVGLTLFTRSYMSKVHSMIPESAASLSEYADQFGKTSFFRFTTNSLWFTGSIIIGATALILYMFLIWYRDWLGKNMFIYRLLMIPTSRMNVYFAKLSAIVLLVLGLVSFELLILPLLSGWFNLMIPSELREPYSSYYVVTSHPLLRKLVPMQFVEFLLYYAAGAGAVIVVFTAILIERSYRIKGAIGGIVYGICSLVIVVMPIVISENYQPFFIDELFWLVMLAGLIVTAGSLAFSAFLIRKKATV